MGNKVHPITKVRHYFNEEYNTSKYSDIAKAAAAKYEDFAEYADPVERIGQLIASRTRILDKWNLVKDLVGMSVGAEDGTLSDNDVLTILAAKAAEDHRRWSS